MKRPRKWNTTSDAKVIKFVETNPGLTAVMIAILWRRPYGTISAVLHRLSKEDKISRFQGPGMRGGKVLAWRYYEDINKAAVNAVMQAENNAVGG